MKIKSAALLCFLLMCAPPVSADTSKSDILAASQKLGENLAAVDFCLYWASGSMANPSMPDTLVGDLMDAGFDSSDIGLFKEAYEKVYVDKIETGKMASDFDGGATCAAISENMDAATKFAGESIVEFSKVVADYSGN